MDAAIALHEILVTQNAAKSSDATTKWIKVTELAPESFNHNIVVFVQSVEVVAERTTNFGNIRIGEIVVGDETGSVVISAKNEQIEKLVPGTTVVVRNGRIDMFDGRMRLRVDKRGTLTSYDEEENSAGETLPHKVVTIDLTQNITERKYQWTQ